MWNYIVTLCILVIDNAWYTTRKCLWQRITNFEEKKNEKKKYTGVLYEIDICASRHITTLKILNKQIEKVKRKTLETNLKESKLELWLYTECFANVNVHFNWSKLFTDFFFKCTCSQIFLMNRKASRSKQFKKRNT